jgi:N-acetylmuramoyl-L-alanine amidase
MKRPVKKHLRINMPMKKLAFLTLVVFFLIPSLLAAAEPGQKKRIVIIDAAHGGADGGVIVTDKVREKDVVLAIALLLQKELAKMPGIQVQMTRTSDKTVSTAERRKMTDAAPAEALFIGLHVNAGFGKNATGYEIYFPGFKTTPQEKGGSKAIVKDMVMNKSLNDSVRFAQIIQKNMDPVFPRKGRGLRDAPIPVLNDLTVTAIILELGFATNVDDRKKVMDAAAQQAIAQALAKSVRDYF